VIDIKPKKLGVEVVAFLKLSLPAAQRDKSHVLLSALLLTDSFIKMLPFLPLLSLLLVDFQLFALG